MIPYGKFITYLYILLGIWTAATIGLVLVYLPTLAAITGATGIVSTKSLFDKYMAAADADAQ